MLHFLCSYQSPTLLFQGTVTHWEGCPATPEPQPSRVSRAVWLQSTWLFQFIKSNLLLPRLPCSSLCFFPWNFSHCRPSPGQGLKSGGGAYWQGCRWPSPDWIPYLFTHPESPPAQFISCFASSVLNKKGKNSV